MSGNFALSATAKFLTAGNAHRKAVIMLRESSDADSPFVQSLRFPEERACHWRGLPE